MIDSPRRLFHNRRYQKSSATECRMLEPTMMSFRLAGLSAVALLLVLLPMFANVCWAQTTPGGNTQNPTQGSDKTQQQGQTQQNQTTPASPPIVAGQGATVVVPGPSSTSGSNGLIVAAPGSTVVVQQAPPAAQAKTPTASKPNQFSSKSDANIITMLSKYAANKDQNDVDQNYGVLVRAGAIDALGNIGGTDQTTNNLIVDGLTAVLDREFINNNMKFKNTNGSSQFLCFHAVQALGNLGWGGRAGIFKMQLLRGQDAILDSAIDNAISAMQSAAPPQTTMPNPMNQPGANPMNQPGGNPM